MSFMFRYHFRLIWLMLRYLWQGKPVAHESRLTYRASASDCDLFGHINNGRYLEFFDFGRMDLFLRTGFWRHARNEGVLPMVAAQSVRYLKEVRWGQKFEVETTFDRLDGKAMVLRGKILINGDLVTETECTLLAVQRGKVIDPTPLLPFFKT